MRHYYQVTAILTALLLNACSDVTQNDVTAPTAQAPVSTQAQSDIVTLETVEPLPVVMDLTDTSAMTARYQGLDAKDISQAEIDELISIQAAQAKVSQTYQAEIEAWSAQGASRRGPEPTYNGELLSQEDTERLGVLSGKLQIAEMRKRYNSLDPKDISKAEIEELITLQKAQMETNRALQKEQRAWFEQDASRRGPQPQWPNVQPSERLLELSNKVQVAEIRKRYENFDSNVLSKAEVEEMISLQQDQQRKMLAYQREIQAWMKQDPATRGPQPNMNPATYMNGENPRLQALQSKVRGAEQAKRFADRVERLRKTHNLSISDTEISELTALQTEQQEFQVEMNRAMMEATNSGQFAGGNMDPNAALDNIPKDVLQRMFEVGQRIQAIQAPVLAAENADRIRQQMTQLSETSGVPILSGDIAESIALNAEKDRIQNKARIDAAQKYLTEGGSMNAFRGDPIYAAEDYARLKEIDARIKAISAPMTEAQNAAADARDPAMKQYRLAQEERQKWQTDWQDRKQAGEIPADAVMNSPSYAEIQDRVQNYDAKLKSRADKVGYHITASEMKRLEGLNETMLDIRKTVHDMEVDGSSMVTTEKGRKTQAFGLTAGMYKIRLIEQKQREILAGLIEAEMPNIQTPGGAASQIGTRQFDHRNSQVFNGGQYGLEAQRMTGADAIIQSARARGLDISISEEDDLRTFELDIQDR